MDHNDGETMVHLGEIPPGKHWVIAKGASLRVRGISLVRALSPVNGEADVQPGCKLALLKELAWLKVLQWVPRIDPAMSLV